MLIGTILIYVVTCVFPKNKTAAPPAEVLADDPEGMIGDN